MSVWYFHVCKRSIAAISFASALATFPQSALAQRCAPASIAYVVRDQNGAPLSLGDLSALRWQPLPASGGVQVSIDSAATPALLFRNEDPCLLNLRSVTLIWKGMRMQLAFDIELPLSSPLKNARIESPPFQNGAFVFNRNLWTANSETVPASAWRSIADLDRGGTPFSPPSTDCASTVRASDPRLFVLRFRSQSIPERRDCLAVLAGTIADSANVALAEQSARSIEAAAYANLVSDADILDPLIGCVERHLNQLGAYCNRALAALTRHSYGVAAFAGNASAPPLTATYTSSVVADWNALRRSASQRHIIFDDFLADESFRAVSEVGDSLRAVIARSLPLHPAPEYIANMLPGAPSLLRGQNETVFHLALGRLDRPGLNVLPANWPNGPLRGLRLLLLRPGLPRPASGISGRPAQPDFPAAEADYREEFAPLDLEVRFQINTSDSALKQSAIYAVRRALSGLREAQRLSQSAAALGVSLGEIRSRCGEHVGPSPVVAVNVQDCRVSAIDSVGVVDDTAYYAAIYCRFPDYASPDQGARCGGESFNARYHSSRTMTLFTRVRGSRDLAVAFERGAESDGVVFLGATIATNSAGTMLQLAIAMDGTGNFNASEYYLRANGKWEPVEASSWLNDLTRRLPGGLEVWKGIWPDVRTLRAEAGLYRAGDGNCCPTGGTARIQLAIRSGRFVLEGVELIRGLR